MNPNNIQPINIMGFESVFSNDRKMKHYVWWFFAGCCGFIMLLSGVVYKITTGSVSLGVGFQGIIQSLVVQPQLQRYILSIVDHSKTYQTPSLGQLMAMYDQRYHSSCDDESNHLLCHFYPYREELASYLGFDTPKTYLVLLQNSAEIRPNGGFYGSFVRLTLSGGMIDTMTVHDSYEVLFADSGVVLTLPDRTSNYLGHNEATFIASNKFGFTERDGRIITSIYNKTYNTTIDGVIFVSTNTMISLVPQLQSQLWKRQFVNASVDLIRNHTGGFKKELYLTDMKSYLASNKFNLLSQALTHIHKLAQPSMLQIYLPQASSGLQSVLRHHNWITELDPYHLYLRDINQSYNKVSNFVIKSALLMHNNSTIVSTQDTIMDLSTMDSGDYQLLLRYDLNVPNHYKQYIASLEKEYDIALTDRERHILALKPEFDYRSVIFAGSGIEFHYLTGELSDTIIFDAPPNQAAAYRVSGSGQTRTLTIGLTKK